MPSQLGAILFQFQLFRTSSATNGVIVIASLFTHQKYGYDFLLALGHSQISTEVKTIGPTFWIRECTKDSPTLPVPKSAIYPSSPCRHRAAHLKCPY